MAGKKIGELTPLGRNLISTDELELSLTGSAGSRKITGSELTAGLQPTLALTTTGTSGAATLVGATLNIPQYSGGGGASGIHAPIKPPSGTAVSSLFNYGALSSMSLFANRMYLIPFIPLKGFSSSNMYMNVGTGVSGGLGKIIIYADNNGVPDSLIYESANLDLSTIGVKTASVTQSFTAGTTYWIAFWSNTTASVNSIANSNLINLGYHTGGLSAYVALIVNATFGAAPNPLGAFSRTSVQVPFVGITAA